MRFNPSSKSRNFGKVDYNDRYVILNHHSGELRLFHSQRRHHPMFNPKLFSKAAPDRPRQVLNFERYFPFDYGRKEYCAVSRFLPESFTRNIRRMINDFNLEVLREKKLELKESFRLEVGYLRSLLHSTISKTRRESHPPSESPRQSGKLTRFGHVADGEEEA